MTRRTARWRVATFAILLAGGVRTADAQSLGASDPRPSPTMLSLDDAERRALASHPVVARAAAALEAALGVAHQAGTPPNPVIGYDAEEVSGGPINRYGEHGVFFEQEVPLGAKLRRAREAGTSAADVARVALERAKLGVRTDVRWRYIDAAIASRRVAVREELLRVVQDAVGASSQLANVGAADKPDVLAAEIEGERAQLALTAARNQRFRAFRDLGVAMGETALAPIDLDVGDEEAVPELARDEWWARIREESPDLAALRASIAQSEAALRLAERATAPDLIIKAGALYNRELLEPAFKPVGWEARLEVGLRLPLINRNRGGIRAARAEVDVAKAELSQRELALAGRFNEAFERYLTAQAAAERYRNAILPRARQAHDLYLASYRQMAAAYPQVLIAERTLASTLDEYLDTLAAAWREATRIRGLLATTEPEARNEDNGRDKMTPLAGGTGR
ncbi:MAG: TolC family protein [Vicinamibacterales bacterium]